MRYLYICNTTQDSINKIGIEKFALEDVIKLEGVNENKVGPHGLCIQGDQLFTSNCYDGSVSIVNLKDLKSYSYYLGRNCRDICALGNHLYIICGDSNNVVTFDLNKKEIIEIIPCGDSPHSIDCCNHSNEIVVANNGDDTITVFDSLYGSDIKNIKVGQAPTKALFTLNGDYILVCESSAGSLDKGCVSVISSRNHKVIHRLSVGNCPFDMYCDEKFCYVSNYGDGTISIIDIINFINVKSIRIGGMPRGIICDERYIYVGDSYNDLIMRIDKNDNHEKLIIPLKGQPTGMIID
ncbi:YncE family protein [Clostridium sp. UBA4395]|uniref:YncE family protein n=1 Tax=Clostridium sp. UBA4395 TaxID=1946360 RepID=UPI003216C511